MNVVAYTALHYGSDFLYWAIRSVIDHVDKFYVLYTPVGSHGSRTAVPCPDSRESLYRLAKAAAKDKLVWHESDQWTNEGQQRETIHALAPGATCILVVDTDEIWSVGAVEAALLCARYENAHLYRLPMVHFWRSFYRAIINDQSLPVRMILPKVKSGTETISAPAIAGELTGPIVIAHMGYAQREEIVNYKQLTHGHRGEWRSDWYAQRFLPNAQEDCHPVNIDYWFPVPVDPWVYLPNFMRQHPYATKEVIE